MRNVKVSCLEGQWLSTKGFVRREYTNPIDCPFCCPIMKQFLTGSSRGRRRHRRQIRHLKHNLKFKFRRHTFHFCFRTWTVAHQHVKLNSSAFPNRPKPLLNHWPIYNIPNPIHVLLLIIEELQIVRMLPHIDSKQRLLACRHNILIFRRRQLEIPSRVVLNQPAPSATLDPKKNSCESIFEPLDRRLASFDCSSESWVWVAARCWGRQILPEQGMVDVAAGIEVYRCLKVYLND